jgi:hypothetical protein
MKRANQEAAYQQSKNELELNEKIKRANQEAIFQQQKNELELKRLVREKDFQI